jgi:hypothetical protein
MISEKIGLAIEVVEAIECLFVDRALALHYGAQGLSLQIWLYEEKRRKGVA